MIDSFDFSAILKTEGLFASSFQVNLEHSSNDSFHSVDISSFKDTVEMTSNFRFDFLTSGLMINGVVSTVKLLPKFETVHPLRNILTTGDFKEYFLSEHQVSKFMFLKNGKKIQRLKPNGEPYFYSEGGMSFPDSLDLPGRTMLTSEGTVNRSTHVVEDEKSGKYRFITPVEAERLQCFPDNWTNTGMPKSRRYFMMGNALVTSVVKRLEKRLDEIISSS